MRKNTAVKNRKNPSLVTKTILWTRAGGPCEYENCNNFLLGDVISGHADLNKSYIAHIVAAEPNGPRGDAVRSALLVDKIENLMLMCDTHHRLIDVGDVAGHPEARLLTMKVAHERRIESLTAFQEDRATHVLLYGARIGEHDCPVDFESAKAALRQDGRYAADNRPLLLNLDSYQAQSHESEYWATQIGNLRRQFDRVVRQNRDIKHLSVFAIAPQPLLIELGRLVCDLFPSAVYQRHREPVGWTWESDGGLTLVCKEPAPESLGTDVALKVALSATVTDDRIHTVLGPRVPIWSLEAELPHNDILKSTADLAQLRTALRRVFDRIKARYGEQARIHLFPVAPVSAAVEIGRVWMPRSDLPMTIYDNDRAHGGFVERSRIEAPSTQLQAT